MAAGPFEWKQALLGSKVRVELSDTEISVGAGMSVQAIEFKNIDRVYYYRMYATPYIHLLSVAIESNNGERARFGASGYGAPNGFNAQECRKATIAFLSHFEHLNPEAQVYEGAKPSPWNKWLFMGIIIAVLTFTSFQTLRDSPFQRLMTTLVMLGGVAIIVVFFGWRELRKLNNPKLVSARSMREALELFDESI